MSDPMPLRPIFRMIAHSPFAIGSLSATPDTPEIVFPCDDRSLLVAQTSFLTFRALDPEIRARAMKKVNRLICAISPIGAGDHLERCVRDNLRIDREHEPDFLPQSMADRERDNNRIGRYYKDKGVIAVYAESMESDLDKGLSASFRRHAVQMDIHPLEDMIRIFDHEASVRDINLNMQLQNFVHKQATYIGYANVPSTLGHEIGHAIDNNLLWDIDATRGIPPRRGTEERALFLINKQVSEKISPDDDTYGYFTKPGEAVAELIGNALLDRVQKRTGVFLPTSRLEKQLPVPFQIIKTGLGQICGDPEPNAELRTAVGLFAARLPATTYSPTV
jgi:hypothetical protein